MAQQSENSQIMPRSARRAQRVTRAVALRARSRSGHITTFLLFALPMMLLAMALVLNWLFAGMVNRRTAHLDDVLARVGVSALLDEEVLQDMPANDADDAADASALVSDYLNYNNAALAARLQPQFSDLSITPGRVEDITMPYSGAQFIETSAPAALFNTLRVKIERPRSGMNPVELIMRNIGGVPEAVDIFTVSYASLDSRLTGFAPTVNRPTPLAPLAILNTAWFTDRPAAMDDSALPNGRYEIDIDLNDSTGAMGASTVAPIGALLDFDDAGPVNFAAMPAQITDGVYPADLAGGDIMASAGSPFMNVGTQDSPNTANTNAIAAAFNTVAASPDPRRIFPIYDTFGGGEANLIGFVGATVISASNITGGGAQLRVRVEPEFIVHVTATTDPAVVENLYIHKIRLTR